MRLPTRATPDESRLLSALATAMRDANKTVGFASQMDVLLTLAFRAAVAAFGVDDAERLMVTFIRDAATNTRAESANVS